MFNFIHKAGVSHIDKRQVSYDIVYKLGMYRTQACRVRSSRSSVIIGSKMLVSLIYFI